MVLLFRTEFMARIILSKKKFRSLRKKLTKLNIFPQLNPLDNRSGSKRKQSAFFGPCLVLEVAAWNRAEPSLRRPRTTSDDGESVYGKSLSARLVCSRRKPFNRLSATLSSLLLLRPSLILKMTGKPVTCVPRL